MMKLTKIFLWVKTHVVLASAIVACTAIAVIVPVAWAVHSGGFSPFGEAHQNVSVQSTHEQKKTAAKDTKKDTTPAPAPQPVYTYQDMIDKANYVIRAQQQLLKEKPFNDYFLTDITGILQFPEVVEVSQIDQADRALYTAA